MSRPAFRCAALLGLLLPVLGAATRPVRATPAPAADSNQDCRAAIAVAEREQGIPTGLLVHCNSDRAPENEIVIRNAGTRILCRPIRLDGSYQGVSRSIDALADLVRELAEFPGEFVIPKMLRAGVR